MREIRQLNMHALLFILLSSYASLSLAQPDWVEGMPEDYPDDRYLTASASASTMQRAKDRALANLSKVFEARVDEISTTRSNTAVNIVDGQESFTRHHKLNQQIRVSTDKILHGARIADTYKDDLFVYHALAVLDRSQAANNLKHEIERIDEHTATELQRSRSASDPLQVIASLDAAISKQNERYAFQKMLKVVDRSGVGQPSEWNLAEIKARLEDALANLRFSAAIDQDPIGKLDSMLLSAMGNAGFPALSNGGDYVLVASLSVQDLGLRQGWYWLRGKLDLKLIEKDGKVRGRKQWPLKVSALQQNDAESRLQTQISEKLDDELRDTIIEFATQ